MALSMLHLHVLCVGPAFHCSGISTSMVLKGVRHPKAIIVRTSYGVSAGFPAPPVRFFCVQGGTFRQCVVLQICNFVGFHDCKSACGVLRILLLLVCCNIKCIFAGFRGELFVCFCTQFFRRNATLSNAAAEV